MIQQNSKNKILRTNKSKLFFYYFPFTALIISFGIFLLILEFEPQREKSWKNNWLNVSARFLESNKIKKDSKNQGMVIPRFLIRLEKITNDKNKLPSINDDVFINTYIGNASISLQRFTDNTTDFIWLDIGDTTISPSVCLLEDIHNLDKGRNILVQFPEIEKNEIKRIALKCDLPFQETSIITFTWPKRIL